MLDDIFETSVLVDDWIDGDSINVAKAAGQTC
jgi:hypothetical protein